MKNRMKVMIIGLICLMAFVGAASADTMKEGYTSTEGIPAELLTGANAVTCAQLQGLGYPDCTGDTLYIPAEPWAGTKNLLGGYTISITENNNVVEWESDAKINCIFLKSGNGGDVYEYSGYCYPENGEPISADSRLSTPLNCNNNGVCSPKDISHIVVCYDQKSVPPPPINAPEFPSVALPVGMMIGIAGLVFLTKSREK